MSSLESFRRITRNIPGKGLWKGPDVHVSEDTLLQPSPSYDSWVNIEVTITRDNLPPLDGACIDDLSFLFGSLKSRRAQSGVDLYELPGNVLAQQIEKTAYSREYKNKPPINSHGDPVLNYSEIIQSLYEQEYHGLIKFFNVPYEGIVLVANRAAKPIRLDKGMGLFRFFLPLSAPVSGKELLGLLKEGEIYIDGERGTDWNVIEDEGLAVGVMVKVDPQSEKWIIDQGEDPIYISDTDQNYRKNLDQTMSPLPKNRPVLCIGETPRTQLSERVEGVIHKATSPTIDGNNWLYGANYHSNSYLVDAGSNWRIRTEIFGKKGHPRYIYYNFYLNR